LKTAEESGNVYTTRGETTMRNTLFLSVSFAALALPVLVEAQEFKLRVPLGLDERALIIPNTEKTGSE